MPRFVNERDTVTIQAPWWDAKEVCVIRKFGYGDRQFLAGETVTVGISTDGAGAEPLADVAIGRMNLAILERGIVSWTDADGNDVPVTRERIAALAEDDGEFILAEINRANPRRGRTPEEQATFRGVGRDRNPGEKRAAE